MKRQVLEVIAGSKKSLLKIGNAYLECYVLDDSTRVFSGNGLQKALGFPKNAGGTALTKLLKAGSLNEVVTNDVWNKIQDRKEFKRPGAGGALSKTYGYDVTLLIDICDLLIEGRNLGVLNEKQKEYAIIGEIIIRSVAKVGIIALVDEATGYQDIRMSGALEIMFNKILLKEAKKYKVTFPLELYRQWFRLNGWEWKPENAQKRPGVLGTWTKKYIYSRIAPNLLKELEIRNPKNEKGYREFKHFQFLSDEIGEPRLQEFFGGLIALARASSNWRNYVRSVERAYPQNGDQLGFLFNDIE